MTHTGTEPERPSGDDRADPPWVSDERSTVEGFLEYHRATFRWKCSGLGGEQLATRSMPPSTLTLLGLIRHLSEVERSWFRRVLAGEDAPPLYYDDVNRDGDFDDIDPEQAEQALATYDAEVAAARALAASYDSFDAIAAEKRHGVQEVSLRWIMLHMIEEYARHNGHADFLREAIDGLTGE